MLTLDEAIRGWLNNWKGKGSVTKVDDDFFLVTDGDGDKVGYYTERDFTEMVENLDLKEFRK